jgi:hypothetical protein
VATGQSGPPLRICICGSMTALSAMEAIAETLQGHGFRTVTPVPEEQRIDWDALSREDAVAAKRPYLDGYFEEIRNSQLVLIANLEKNGIPGYVGANALMEATCAYVLGIPVLFLNPIGKQGCQIEAQTIAAGILGGDIHNIFPFLEAVAEQAS